MLRLISAAKQMRRLRTPALLATLVAIVICELPWLLTLAGLSGVYSFSNLSGFISAAERLLIPATVIVCALWLVSRRR